MKITNEMIKAGVQAELDCKVGEFRMTAIYRAMRKARPRKELKCISKEERQSISERLDRLESCAADAAMDLDCKFHSPNGPSCQPEQDPELLAQSEREEGARKLREAFIGSDSKEDWLRVFDAAREMFSKPPAPVVDREMLAYAMYCADAKLCSDRVETLSFERWRTRQWPIYLRLANTAIAALGVATIGREAVKP